MSAVATNLFPPEPEAQIKAVERGVSVSKFNAFRESVTINAGQLAELLGISKSTLMRLSKQPRGEVLPQQVSDRLWRLWNIRRLAVELCGGDGQAADRWLAAPHFSLGDKAPLELMTSEAGAKHVETVIGRTMHGIAV